MYLSGRFFPPGKDNFMLKRLVLSALAFISAFALLSITAFAYDGATVYYDMPIDEFTPDESVTVVKSGICGNMGSNVTWTQYSDGTVYISGSGNMASFSSTSGSTASPWKGSEEVTRVIVSEGVTRLGNYAFYKCPNLTSVILPDGLEAIGAGSLNSCTSLSEIKIPFTVNSINNYAFSGCTSLTSIIIPSGVQTIYSGTFNSCTSLSQIVLTGGNTAIQSGTFYKSERVIIYSYDDGNPKAQAEKLGVPFEYYVLPGDTDFDYQLKESDLPGILNYIKSIEEPTGRSADNADVYKDSVIDIRDFNSLYNKVANKIS